MLVQENLEIEERDKRGIYFIPNKEDVQNDVYDNYGDSFLILKEFFVWECYNTCVNVNKRDLFRNRYLQICCNVLYNKCIQFINILSTYYISSYDLMNILNLEAT